MSNNKTTIEDLIAGGLIGAALGALLSKDKGKGTALGAIAGAVIAATLKANEEAKKEKLPLLYEKDGYIFESLTNGKVKKIKKVEESKVVVLKKFNLK